MLLRISLIVALLAALGALYLGHFKVSERINTLTTELDTSKKNETAAKQAENKAKTEAKKAKDELAQASQDLAEKSTLLETAKTRLSEQEKRANKYFEDLTNATRERNEAQQELAVFKAAGVSADQIKAQRDIVSKLTAERDTLVTENQLLLRERSSLKFELSRYQGPKEIDVPLPAGLKGRVLAVDPKYDFIVLDIGGNQGVVANGKMLLNRDGKLVAKVRITRVEPNRSIANILPDWKQQDVMEGDQAIVY